jgi:hypothetical protein
MSLHYATQDEQILNALQMCVDRWVSALGLAQRSGSLAVHSRISHLRAAGWKIRCRVRRAEDGGARPAYMLVSDEKWQAWQAQGFPLCVGEKVGRWMRPDETPRRKLASPQTLKALTVAIQGLNLSMNDTTVLAGEFIKSLRAEGWTGIRWDEGLGEFVS